LWSCFVVSLNGFIRKNGSKISKTESVGHPRSASRLRLNHPAITRHQTFLLLLRFFCAIKVRLFLNDLKIESTRRLQLVVTLARTEGVPCRFVRQLRSTETPKKEVRFLAAPACGGQAQNDGKEKTRTAKEAV
jgi:hypothetical protein